MISYKLMNGMTGTKANQVQLNAGSTPNINYKNFFTPTVQRRKPSYLREVGARVSNLPQDKSFVFAFGSPNPTTFPYAELSVKLKDGSNFKIHDADLEKTFAAINAGGHPPLVRILQEYTDKLHCTQDWTKKEIVITCGIQGALFNILQMFLSEGDAIIVQSPLYTGTRDIIRDLNVECIECDFGEYGFSLTSLKETLENRKSCNLPMPKLMYVIPTGSNPTGMNICNKRKAELYATACQYNILILEDDPYFFFNFDETEDAVSFLTLDTERRVIRFDSFSKLIGMGFRIGYITAPKEITDQLTLVQEISSVPSTVSSVILYHTLKSMGFVGYLEYGNKIKQFYRQNRDCLLRALEKYLKDEAEWVEPNGGLFVWIKIKKLEHISQSFIEKCLEKFVVVIPGFAFYVKDTASPHIRLSYSLLTSNEIERGTELLSQLIKEEIE